MPYDEIVPSELDRVRSQTKPDINERIDKQIERNIEYFSSQSTDAISRRLLELEMEWDIERLLETNAAVVALTGSLLTAFVHRGWVVLPIAVTGFLLQHALQGWCPPLPVFRKLGVRTKGEIDAEKFALKALRGDFDDLKSDSDMHTRADKAVRAVKEEYYPTPTIANP